MRQALYRKWRPQTFDDVVGQEHVVHTLRQALQTDHIHHAYLLAGPRGIGKTTTARLIAKAVNCLAPVTQRPCDQCEICAAVSAARLMDLVEIDAASNTGVDNIRELLEKVGFRPAQARYKVYVVDEVHMLSTAAFNALLKTLEEPPEHVIFILATTEVHKIPETILSRCQRFELRRIPLDRLVERLRMITEVEGIEAEPEALTLIARAATGSMRDAISLLDQMAVGGSVTADYVRSMLGAERREVVQSLLQAWLAHDLNGGIQLINQAVDAGADPRQLARQTADFLRGLLLMHLGAGESWTEPMTEERPHLERMAGQTTPERLIEAIELFSEVASARRSGWQPQLPLELAFVNAALERSTTLTTESPAAPAANPVTPATRTPEVTPSRPTPIQTPQAARPEPKKAEPASAQPAAADEIVSTIEQKWRDILQSQPIALGALLRDARVAGADAQGRLVLAFEHPFHCGKINEDENRRKVEETLSQACGQRVTVRCVLSKEWTPIPRPSPAAAEARTEEPIQPEEDVLLRRAQRELGAVAKSEG